MRVSDASRVLFVHVPKTGGSTIDLIFDEEVSDARRVSERKRHATYARLVKQEPGLREYWSCGFVRNPWARMVSWWSMGGEVFTRAEQGRERAVEHLRANPEHWAPFGEYRHDFRRFVLEGTVDVKRFGTPQLSWLATRRGRRVDFIGKVENFVHDVNVVRDRLGLPPAEDHPRKNKSTHGHYSEYYDDETRTRVAEVFADDIEAFGYTFDAP
jgi:sulfotransferase famil protein